MWTRVATLAGLVGLPALFLVLGLGCAGWVGERPFYDYFSSPDPGDAWSSKIAGWQRRERGEPAESLPLAPSVAGFDGEATPVGSEALRSKYRRFRAERKRALARELAGWIQSQAKSHYVPDGPVDHWATLEETLRENGDDCDGLELLTFHALRELGFAPEEVFRAIVYRESDKQHHMVTLWFEDANDPWVIDPTGAMTKGMPRMSDLPDWVPLKVFSDSTEYSVRPEARSPAAQFAANP